MTAPTQDASEAPDGGAPIEELPLLPMIDEHRFAFAGERARGGVGRIIEAHDELLGRRIAVKQLLRTIGTHDAARFVREAMLTARLQHPAIVPVYDAGVRASGEPYFAMPLVQGSSLHDAIAATRTLDDRLALLPHVQAVADAIAYAHEQGIVHRDLKPANVLVGAFGETAVIDWGLAKEMRGETADEERAATEPAAALELPVALTATGAVLGTPAYMAPEQARGEQATERSDVYAIGAILFELLTGRAPHRTLGESPPAIESIEPGAPRDLVAIVARAMAAAPESRYPSARELAADLRRFATGQLVGARRYSAWALLQRWLRRHRVTVSVAGVLAIALAVTATVSALRIVRERDRAEAESNRMRLLQAEALVDRDPTAAAAWLSGYSLERGENVRTAQVAARAADGGVARWVLTLPDETPMRACLSPNASHAIVLGRSGAVWRFDLVARTRVKLGSHGALPSGCAFSSDGRSFVTLSTGGLHVGSVDDDALWTPDLPAPLGALAWDGQGAAIVSTHGDRMFVVDVAAKRASELAGLPAGAMRAVLDRDRRTLYIVDNTGGVWRTSTTAGATAEKLEQLDAPAFSVELSRDGGRLVIATRREVYVRELTSAVTHKHRFAHDAPDPVIARPAARGVVFITALDQTVHWWQPETGELRTLGSKAFYKGLAAAGDRAAWANVDGSLLVADLDGGRTRVFTGHESSVRDLDLTTDGRWLATTHDGMVRVFSLAEPPMYGLSLPPLHSRARTANRIDGTVLYDEGGGRIMRIDPTRRERKLVAEVGEDVTSMVVAPSGKEVALCGVKGTVAVVDLARGVVERLVQMPVGCRFVQLLGPVLLAEGMNHVAFQWDFATRTRKADVALDTAALARSQPLGTSTAPGSRVASIQNDGASIYDAATGQLEHVPIAGGRVFGGTLAHDENSAVFGMSDGRVVEWRVGRPGVRELARLEGFAARLSFARDGREVFVAAEGGAVAAIRIADGQLRRIGRHAARVSAFALSRSNERLAAGDASGELRVYEPATGAVAVLQRHGAELHWIAFLRDDLLVSLDAAGTLQFWPLPRERFVPVEPAALATWIAALTTARVTERAGTVETAIVQAR
jgi:WD40 repeat protein